MSFHPSEISTAPKNAATFKPVWDLVLRMHRLQKAGVEDDTPAMRDLASRLSVAAMDLEYEDHLYLLSDRLDALYESDPAPTGTRWAVATVTDQTWGYYAGDTKADSVVHKFAHLYALEENARTKVIELALKFDISYFIWEVHNVPEFRLRPDTW